MMKIVYTEFWEAAVARTIEVEVPDELGAIEDEDERFDKVVQWVDKKAWAFDWHEQIESLDTQTGQEWEETTESKTERFAAECNDGTAEGVYKFLMLCDKEKIRLPLAWPDDAAQQYLPNASKDAVEQGLIMAKLKGIDVGPIRKKVARLSPAEWTEE